MGLNAGDALKFGLIKGGGRWKASAKSLHLSLFAKKDWRAECVL